MQIEQLLGVVDSAVDSIVQWAAHGLSEAVCCRPDHSVALDSVVSLLHEGNLSATDEAWRDRK